MPEHDDEREQAEFEAAAERVRAALLIEYPWETHDNWSSDDEARNHENPWPHLRHVAEVAAHAVLSSRTEVVPHPECVKTALRNGTVDPREQTLALRDEVTRLREEMQTIAAGLDLLVAGGCDQAKNLIRLRDHLLQSALGATATRAALSPSSKAPG